MTRLDLWLGVLLRIVLPFAVLSLIAAIAAERIMKA